MKHCEPITIIVNTLNRANLLKDTLASFQHLDYPSVEVVVVNGPSTDESEDLLREWEGKIKVGKCPEANLSMSRNIGIAMASGEFVAFIDDDAIPEPEWLNQAIMGFDTNDVAATGGKVFDHTGYSFQYEYANANRLGHGKWQLTRSHPHYCFPGSYEFPYLQGTNTIFRRSALLKVGGFDEEFAYYLDETDVCLRLIDEGYLVKQLHDAYVHHKYAPSHIRTKTTAVYRYPVLKSKIYFANRYGKSYHSQTEIDDDNYQFLQNHRSDVAYCVETGRLSVEDQERFEEHAEQAWSVGIQAAKQPRKLITPELLASYQSPFKAFETLRPAGQQLTIALLCEDYPPNLLGGIARFTQDKATALAKLGHKVHVIARSLNHNTVDLEDGVWVHRIVAKPQLKSTEVQTFNIPQSHWDQSKSLLDELDRISTHRPIDIVEAPIWNVVGIAPLLSGRFKVITSLQTTLKLSLPSKPDLTSNPEVMKTFVNPIVALEKYMIEKSQGVLAISQGIADEVEAAYKTKIDRERLYVSFLGMPDWAADKSFHMQHDAESERVKILFVGRLEKRKGIDVLLETAANLCMKYPSVEFHIVGDDTIKNPEGETYRELFEKKHLSLCTSQVIFHGKTSEDELRQHYADCDIFVAPSRFESFGLIYVEAMMFKKPVVGCKIGGIPEVVADGESGLLVAPGQVDALQRAIDSLVNSKELRQRLGLAGRLRYEQYFTDHSMASSCVNLYGKLSRGNQPSIVSQASE
jgi:glycogen synthase